MAMPARPDTSLATRPGHRVKTGLQSVGHDFRRSSFLLSNAADARLAHNLDFGHSDARFARLGRQSSGNASRNLPETHGQRMVGVGNHYGRAGIGLPTHLRIQRQLPQQRHAHLGGNSLAAAAAEYGILLTAA